METNQTTTQHETDSMEEMSFSQLFEESLKVANEGDVIAGTVIGLHDDMVIIDIGDKSESRIPLSEFKREGEDVAVR